MKQAFRSQRITPDRTAQIDRANEILEDYAGQGYRLTLRQLYYQLVARDIIPNTVKEYNKLGTTCVIGRMNGLIDWNAIEDRLRRPQLKYYVDGVADALEDTIGQYRLDRQKGQPYYMEIWTEKDAVSNILLRVSRPFHIRLMVNRGYSSCSAMYAAFNRLGAVDNKSGSVILYVGDHDPSGLDMVRDIEERLEEFGTEQLQVVPVALTMEQIEKYQPPPNPAKITDPRARWYIAQHGQKSWELDALEPEALKGIMKDAALKHMDIDLYNGMMDREEEDKKQLQEMIEGLD